MSDQAVLTITNPHNGSTQQVPLSGGPLTLGRGSRESQPDIELPDADRLVSRHHASLEYDEHSWSVSPRGMNATTLRRAGELRVLTGRARLRTGDEILILARTRPNAYWVVRYDEPGEWPDLHEAAADRTGRSRQTLGRRTVPDPDEAMPYLHIDLVRDKVSVDGLGPGVAPTDVTDRLQPRHFRFLRHAAMVGNLPPAPTTVVVTRREVCLALFGVYDTSAKNGFFTLVSQTRKAVEPYDEPSIIVRDRHDSARYHVRVAATISGSDGRGELR